MPCSTSRWLAISRSTRRLPWHGRGRGCDRQADRLQYRVCPSLSHNQYRHAAGGHDRADPSRLVRPRFRSLDDPVIDRRRRAHQGTLSVSTLLFRARVEFDVIGVSPRLPVTVQFEPAQLLGALLAGNTTRQIAYRDLLVILTDPRALPLRIVGTPADTDEEWLPQAIVDRVAAAYGSLVPAPAPLDSSYIALRDPGPLDAGTVRWDLSNAVAVPRQWVSTLDPMKAFEIGGTHFLWPGRASWYAVLFARCARS
jgi:hypothetical protein